MSLTPRGSGSGSAGSPLGSSAALAPYTPPASAEEMERETTASRFGDHYFALFLICELTPSFLK